MPNIQKYCIAFLLIIIQLGVKAHPHVFIETKIIVVYSQDVIDKLFVQFDFGPMFSTDLIQNFDSNGSKQFEKDEIKNIYKKFPAQELLLQLLFYLQ